MIVVVGRGQETGRDTGLCWIFSKMRYGPTQYDRLVHEASSHFEKRANLMGPLSRELQRTICVGKIIV